MKYCALPSRCQQPADLHPFWNFRDELSVENQLLFRGDRVVIPYTLQLKILKHLHTGHMGTEKMQLRARSSVFWPRLTNDVKNITKSFEPCQKHAPKQRQEEILVHEPTATKPWSKRRLRNIYSPTSRSNIRSMEAIVGLTDKPGD